jgi:hypothetical protein
MHIFVKLTLLPFLFILFSCGSDDAATTSSSTSLKFITHHVVDIADYNSGTQLAGSVMFDKLWYIDADDPKRTFYEFGSPKSGGGTNPEFAYNLDPDADIYAVSAGTIQTVNYQASTSDYEIYIVPTANTDYMINTDHVRNITVSVGDIVTAGQVLGKVGYLQDFADYPGNFDSPIHDGDQFGTVEIQVFKSNKYYCPTTFYSDSLLATFQSLTNELMSDWETFASDTDIYDENAFTTYACTVDTIDF